MWLNPLMVRSCRSCMPALPRGGAPLCEGLLICGRVGNGCTPLSLPWFRVGHVWLGVVFACTTVKLRVGYPETGGIGSRTGSRVVRSRHLSIRTDRRRG